MSNLGATRDKGLTVSQAASPTAQLTDMCC